MTSLDGLGSIDPDDSRPVSQQIANHLRAAILTGRFKPGERLPSQNELSDRYDVARETVKAALRLLRDERLIVTRQGSGAFVRAQTQRPIGLRPHVESAFERPEVSIDFAGFTGETLHGVLQEPLDKIRAGRLTPTSIAIRILLPDLTQPSVVPALADGTDDPEQRQRMASIARRHVEAIADSVHELADLKLVDQAAVEVRAYAAASLVKLYIVNREEVFFGFYPVIQHTVTSKGKKTAIRDLGGKDSTLFHFTIDDDDHSVGTPFVEQSLAWFDSVWTILSHEYTP
jgi:DNA-binding transcriptional regulator YhcF (GntR family)